jgi:hypothetical protein
MCKAYCTYNESTTDCPSISELREGVSGAGARALEGLRPGLARLDPKLFHQGQEIWHSPVLRDTITIHSDHVEYINSNRATGRWVAHERSLVCAGRPNTSPHSIPHRVDCFDRKVNVGETSPKGPDQRGNCFACSWNAGRKRLVFDKAGVQHFIQDFEIALIEALLD